jgi:hypothetical protein
MSIVISAKIAAMDIATIIHSALLRSLALLDAGTLLLTTVLFSCTRQERRTAWTVPTT